MSDGYVFLDAGGNNEADFLRNDLYFHVFTYWSWSVPEKFRWPV